MNGKKMMHDRANERKKKSASLCAEKETTETKNNRTFSWAKNCIRASILCWKKERDFLSSCSFFHECLSVCIFLFLKSFSSSCIFCVCVARCSFFSFARILLWCLMHDWYFFLGVSDVNRSVKGQTIEPQWSLVLMGGRDLQLRQGFKGPRSHWFGFHF